MARVLGALALTLSGAMGARLINSRASDELAVTEGAISLVREIRVRVECFSMPIGEILAVCDARLLRGCGYESESRPRDLCELARGMSGGGDTYATKLIGELGAEFGRGYREEQLRACDHYLARLAEHRTGLSSTLAQKKKRNAALCLCSAIALAILLL